MALSPRNLLALAAPAFVVLTAGAGCGSSDSDGGSAPAQNEIEFDPFPTTHILKGEEMTSLTGTPDDGSLTFTAPSPAVQALTVGDVLVTGISDKTPGGLLRVVLAVDHDASGALVLTTAAAPLQLAFRKLHVRNVGDIAPIDERNTFKQNDVSPLSGGVRPQWTLASGTVGKSQNYQIVVFDGDGNTATTNDQVKIDATLAGGFKYDLSIDVDWGAVTNLPQAVSDCIASLKKIVTGSIPSCTVEDLMPELKLTFEVDPRLQADVKASGSASIGFEKSFDVGTIDLPPFAIGPLVFVPSADVIATVGGKASAGFSAAAHAHVEIQSKAVLSSKSKNSKLDPFSIKDADATADTPQVDLYASATAKVGVRLNLSLYSVAGPYATANAVAQLEANPLQNPCWDLKFALEAELGVRVTSPRLPMLGYVTFIDWHTPPFRPFDKSVASGTCESTPEGANPPGGGPTAKKLQSPPFTPWAKVLGGPVDGTSVKDVAAFTGAFPFVTPSIDGRFVAGGGGSLGLFKVDDKADGSLTWSKQITPDVPYARALHPLASVPSVDAGLVTLFNPNSDAAFVIAKTGQSGAIDIIRQFVLPDDCVAIPSLLANDRSDGYVAVGYCRNAGSTWFAHLNASLDVVRVRYLVDPDSTNRIHLVPTALVRMADDLVVSGDWERSNQPMGEGQQMFVVRLDDQENVTAPVAYAVPDRLAMIPMAGAPSADGAVTFVGDAVGVGFVARIRKDNSLGFVTFPQNGTGVADWFVPNSVAELPTTGLVVGFSSGVLAAEPPVVTLLGLDGQGKTQWGNNYTLSGANGLRAFAWPSLRITDDGGVLVTAFAGPEDSASDQGALVGMKVFAKDGTLGDTPIVKQSPFTPDQGNYVVKPTPFAPAVQDGVATEKEFTYVP